MTMITHFEEYVTFQYILLLSFSQLHTTAVKLISMVCIIDVLTFQELFASLCFRASIFLKPSRFDNHSIIHQKVYRAQSSYYTILISIIY